MSQQESETAHPPSVTSILGEERFDGVVKLAEIVELLRVALLEHFGDFSHERGAAR